ncbi:MAG: hypothetical protein MJZ74_04570 [Muribaculaceae bacterium]|nr:hypothetical protein [Muribaculaceae bacterium]
MIEEIKKICQNNVLVEIYNNADEDSFFVGRIITCTDDEILIKSYGPNGKCLGYQVMSINPITQICYDTVYLKGLSKVLETNETKHDFPRGYWNDLDILDVFLDICKKNKLMIGLECLYGRKRNGFIISLNDDIVKLEAYDSTGNYDGTCILLREDIKMAEIEGDEQRDIMQFINSK